MTSRLFLDSARPGGDFFSVSSGGDVRVMSGHEPAREERGGEEYEMRWGGRGRVRDREARK